MKLARFDAGNGPRVGVVDGGQVTDIVEAGCPYATMAAVIAGGGAALASIGALAGTDRSGLPLSSVRLLAPVERPGKFLAIGMNYQKHLEEADRLGVARSKHQVWFNKQTSCLSGPFDPIRPGVTEKLDYEVELGVVIGRAAKGVAREGALDHVFGYLVVNDVSARDWQFHSPTFTMGKSFDTHGPVGPWIVTADEIPDPQALPLRCLVNGEVRRVCSPGAAWVASKRERHRLEAVALCRGVATRGAVVLVGDRRPGERGHGRDGDLVDGELLDDDDRRAVLGDGRRLLRAVLHREAHPAHVAAADERREIPADGRVGQVDLDADARVIGEQPKRVVDRRAEHVVGVVPAQREARRREPRGVGLEPDLVAAAVAAELSPLQRVADERRRLAVGRLDLELAIAREELAVLVHLLVDDK